MLALPSVGAAQTARHPEDNLRLPCAAQPNSKTIDLTGRRNYRGCQFKGNLDQPEASARAFLAHFATPLAINANQADLVLADVRRTSVSAHTRFEQQHEGVPIYGAFVQVNQGSDGSIVSLHTSYRVKRTSGSAQPGISRSRALLLAKEAAGVQEVRLAHRYRKVWFPLNTGELRIAREFWVYSADPLGDFLTVVDGETGKILFQENRIAFDVGSAKLFSPNPVQHTGNTSLSDNNDANSPTLEASRIDVVLKRLDSGTGQLRGTWVDVTLAGGTCASSFAEEPDRIYDYTRDNPFFEQVMIYYTVDQIQEYFHSLGFDDDTGAQNGVRDFPSKANAQWDDADNSFYSTGDDAIHFGCGGVDDAEDADVIAHEFGHAVQHQQNSCWGGGEMGAMGEAFGDYLAYTFFLGAGDPTYQGSDAACIAEWDATSYSSTNPPCLRRVDTGNHYPEDLQGQVHHDGQIWSHTLREIHLAIGRETADQLILQHHFGLPCNATMADAVAGLLQADVDLNGGANEAAIRTAACDRGILTGEACAAPSGLNLTVSANPSPASTGATVTYTATVQNSGTEALEDLTLTAAVPLGSEYVAASASNSGSGSGGIVQWPIFDLNVGSSAQRTFQVTVTVTGGSGIAFEDDMEAGGSLWALTNGSGSANWELSEDNAFGGSKSAGKVPTSVVAATACADGHAGVFACHKTNLEQFLPFSAIGGGTDEGNDGWGWTDPTTNREYYIAGRQSGVSFLDVTDPQSPVLLGTLATHTASSDWRDVKVLGNHAFIVSEASGHGMQVFDLTQLRNVPSPPHSFSATAHYDGFGNCHNLGVNEDTDFVYAVGTGSCAGGLHIVDVSTPSAPTFAGCYSDDGYTHDVQCVVYSGPDSTYSGREICFAYNEDTLTIVDVTNKSAPVQISRTSYAGVSYTHQGWLTEDQVHILMNDELDEQNAGHKTRTYIVDVSDLDAPDFAASYTGALPSIDHNNYTRGDFVYQANYTSGLRILKLTDISSGTLCEVASFDVYPDSDSAIFAGAWSAFPYYPSGLVAINSIEGVVLVRPDLSDPQCVGPGEGSGASWFATDPSGLSDQYLTTQNAFSIQADAELRFWSDYDFETGYDGGVVEISTDGGSSWGDLGTYFTSGGYNDTISTQFENAISGREAFSGSSGGYKQSVVDLSSFAGESVKIRFRSASDSSVGGVGWYVDEILVGEEVALTLVASVSPAGGSATEVTVNTEVVASACGNGVVDGGEICDPGVTGSTCCTGECVLASAGAFCRLAVGACDVAETCTGTDVTCPTDAFSPSGGTCRSQQGACDLPELCTGQSGACPTDTYAESGILCRAANGICDEPESCTGSGPGCPSDGFRDQGEECRSSTDPCDVTEVCSGASSSCPSDAVAAAGVTCRAVADVCDVVESCDGSSAFCPLDEFSAANLECRASTHVCDAAELCTGSSVSCPPNESAPDGTICNDGEVCTQNDLCEGGVCSGASCATGSSCGVCGGTCSDAGGACSCSF
ncbi:MAG: choice-of-anchor B family protein [Candidatus Binatia bacterium]|nr:choice-of-anchor B family protein [Candidatus Binatia bacterium]